MNKYSIFKTLTNKEIDEVMEYFQIKNYKKDSIIVKEGEYSNMAFILLKGEVSVIKETLYKDDYIITNIKAPADEFFGEVNLIDQGLVTSTIKANSDIEILSITHNDFIELLDEKPLIANKILWFISYDLTKHLRDADKDVITLYNAFVEVVEND